MSELICRYCREPFPPGKISSHEQVCSLAPLAGMARERPDYCRYCGAYLFHYWTGERLQHECEEMRREKLNDHKFDQGKRLRGGWYE